MNCRAGLAATLLASRSGFGIAFELLIGLFETQVLFIASHLQEVLTR